MNSARCQEGRTKNAAPRLNEKETCSSTQPMVDRLQKVNPYEITLDKGFLKSTVYQCDYIV